MNFNWEKSTLDVLGWISIIYESLQPFKKLNINTGLRGRLGGGFLNCFWNFHPDFFVQQLENLFVFSRGTPYPTPN